MFRTARNVAIPVGLALTTVLAAGEANAKAAYMSLEDAVEAAEAIAVVHTEATADCEVRTERQTFRQKVFANPTEVVKGELAAPFELLAAKDFICGSVTYEAPADYLVLLGHDAGHWVTVNHQMGALKVAEGQVQWPYGPGETRPLNEALAEIRGLVGEPPPVPTTDEPRQPEADGEQEPRLCGYAIARMEEEKRRERLIAASVAAGAVAVLLGLVVGFRRRRRRA